MRPAQASESVILRSLATSCLPPGERHRPMPNALLYLLLFLFPVLHSESLTSLIPPQSLSLG